MNGPGFDPGALLALAVIADIQKQAKNGQGSPRMSLGDADGPRTCCQAHTLEDLKAETARANAAEKRAAKLEAERDEATAQVEALRKELGQEQDGRRALCFKAAQLLGRSEGLEFAVKSLSSDGEAV